MWRDQSNDLWEGESESEGRPSTAASFMTAKSGSTLTSSAPSQHPPPGPAASQQHQQPASAVVPAVEVLPALLDDLDRRDAASTEAVDAAAMHLCLLFDSAAGDEAAVLGEALRSSGARGLPRIISLLDDGTRSASVHQSCLLLLANLAAPDIDPHGRIASDLKDLGALRRMLEHVATDRPVLTVAYALGAIRNNANTVQEVELMSSRGTITQLQALANGERSSEDASGRLRQYAAGCLINVRQIIAGADDAGAGGNVSD